MSEPTEPKTSLETVLEQKDNALRKVLEYFGACLKRRTNFMENSEPQSQGSVDKQKFGQWIAVTDRLPTEKDGHEVLYFDGENISTFFPETSKEEVNQPKARCDDFGITHWMPFPDAPSVGRGNAAGAAPVIPTISAIAASREINLLLGKAVIRNTGVEAGFFSGVSISDIAKIIERVVPASTQGARKFDFRIEDGMAFSSPKCLSAAPLLSEEETEADLELPEAVEDRAETTGQKVRKRHSLKVWPVFFDKLADGSKTFETRYADRDYDIGDELELCEFNPMLAEFSGRPAVLRRVTYILRGPAFGVERGWCVMALQPLLSKHSNAALPLPEPEDLTP